jgi:hypothetical protein
MIDRRLQLLLLMNTGCCASCQSQRIDDIISAIETGDAEVRYSGDQAVGLFRDPRRRPIVEVVPACGRRDGLTLCSSRRRDGHAMIGNSGTPCGRSESAIRVRRQNEVAGYESRNRKDAARYFGRAGEA